MTIDTIVSLSKSRSTALILLAIITLGTVLRLAAITHESAWGDEALTTACYPANSFSTCMDCVFAEDARLRIAPIYYWAQYGWSLLAGGSLVSLRLLSVILSIVATLQIFALGRLVAGNTAALWSAAFFNLSLFQIYYGQEVRFYALMNVFALAALHGLVLYLRQPRYRFLLLCATGNALLIWTHTFSVVFVFAQGFLLLGWWKYPRTLLPWFGVHGLMAFGLFGWLALLHYDFAGQSAAYRDMPAGPRELANTLLQFAGGRFSNIDPAPWMTLRFSADILLAGCMAALASFALFQSFRVEGDSSRWARVVDSTDGTSGQSGAVAMKKMSRQSPRTIRDVFPWVQFPIGLGERDNPCVVGQSATVPVSPEQLPFRNGIDKAPSIGASRGDAMLLLITMVGSVVGLYALNWFWRPCFFSRYVVYAALPLYLLAGIGLSTLPRTRLIQRGFAAFILLLFAWQHLALPRPFRADYGELARAVAADSAPRRAVLALKPFNFDAAEYALRDQNVPVQLLYGFKEMISEAQRRSAEGESVWAVFYRWDDTAAFEKALMESGAIVEHHDTAGMPPLDLFHVVTSVVPNRILR